MLMKLISTCFDVIWQVNKSNISTFIRYSVCSDLHLFFFYTSIKFQVNICPVSSTFCVITSVTHIVLETLKVYISNLSQYVVFLIFWDEQLFLLWEFFSVHHVEWCLLFVTGLTLSQAYTALTSHSAPVWKVWTVFLHSSLVCHFWLNSPVQGKCGVRMYANW